MRGNISEKIVKGVFVLEAALALFIIAGVVTGSVDLFKYFKIIYSTPPLQTFYVLQTFLGHTLTLVIGLELVIMLVRHTPSSVIEVLLYAIARKMIIEAKNMLDILLGILAIAGLFAINKVFTPGKFFVQEGTVVNSAMLTREVNELADVNIPEDLGNTIGGVIARLCMEHGEKPAIGTMLRVADADISILSMEDELIKKVKITKTKKG
ncbi:MAG: hypothetical protein PWQ60_2482 [Thermoanaerobacteraceae bacterium]|nr:hypothetical protein [Thermoanaerobacteraceae bacterium]